MQHGSAAVIELLLEGGADVHALCADSVTALCAAVRSDNAAAVAVLLNAGSNVNHAAAGGLLPLHRVRSSAVLSMLTQSTWLKCAALGVLTHTSCLCCSSVRAD
jgi:ankyrin repeat protein